MPTPWAWGITDGLARLAILRCGGDGYTRDEHRRRAQHPPAWDANDTHIPHKWWVGFPHFGVNPGLARDGTHEMRTRPYVDRPRAHSGNRDSRARRLRVTKSARCCSGSARIGVCCRAAHHDALSPPRRVLSVRRLWRRRSCPAARIIYRCVWQTDKRTSSCQPACPCRAHRTTQPRRAREHHARSVAPKRSPSAATMRC